MIVYGVTNDAKEINDTFDTSSSYSNNSTMYTTIDSPYDINYIRLHFLRHSYLKHPLRHQQDMHMKW